MNEAEALEQELNKQVVVYLDESPVTRGELDAIFNLVCDPNDCRAPIDCCVMAAEKQRRLISMAIEFFTGCKAKFESIDGSFFKFRVTAEGYRNGPCGP